MNLVSFGELLARLSTPDYLPLDDAPSLLLHFAGAEANVAVQFAVFGGHAVFVSRLPQNRLADAALEKLRARGVGAADILRGGDRMGVYFLEPGFGPRASVITYDRSHSAMTEIQPGMFDWENILADASWFHWSGITPALGSGAAAACAEARDVALKMGLKISCDVNYRRALWSVEAAASVLPALVRGTHLLFCGANEARQILGAEGPRAGEDSFAELAKSLTQKHDIREVGMVIRTGETAHGGTLRGMLFDGQQAVFSRNHELAVVDRIGTGDSFAGAMLHARMRGLAAQEAVDFATAAAVLNHTIPGDWARGSIEEVEALANGASGGVVRR